MRVSHHYIQHRYEKIVKFGAAPHWDGLTHVQEHEPAERFEQIAIPPILLLFLHAVEILHRLFEFGDEVAAEVELVCQLLQILSKPLCTLAKSEIQSQCTHDRLEIAGRANNLIHGHVQPSYPLSSDTKQLLGLLGNEDRGFHEAVESDGFGRVGGDSAELAVVFLGFGGGGGVQAELGEELLEGEILLFAEGGDGLFHLNYNRVGQHYSLLFVCHSLPFVLPFVLPLKLPFATNNAQQHSQTKKGFLLGYGQYYC